MKYFVVGDVHGYYDELIEGLKQAGFDETNENHTLISLGDAMDRGPKPVEVITYLANLPRKILVRGNHEDLFEDLCSRTDWQGYEKQNGTVDTVKELYIDRCRDLKIKEPSYISHGNFITAAQHAIRNKHWIKYRDLLVDYFETKKHIFVHGWIPVAQTPYYMDFKRYEMYTYISGWRNLPRSDWYSARWTSGFECTKQMIFEPNKTIVCGHWYTSDWHTYFEGAPRFSDFSPYIAGGVIAVDGCVPATHKVNVIIIDDEKEEQ